MPELTIDDVLLYTRDRLADDEETERMLAAALAAARRYCGWHVTPVLTDDEIVVDGPGRSVLSLPTLQLLDVTEIIEDGVTLDVTKLRWSTNKGQVYKAGWGYRWTGTWNGIEATITHGYADAPDFYEAVLSIIDRGSRGSTSGEVTREKVGVYEVRYSAGSAASASALSATEKLKLDSYRILPEP